MATPAGRSMMGLEIAAQQFFVRRARPASVVLAPGALSPAHRLTGPLGQISRTEAVEVDFGQSFEGKKVTSRVSARPFPTSPRFRSSWVAQVSRPAPSGDDPPKKLSNSPCRSVP